MMMPGGIGDMINYFLLTIEIVTFPYRGFAVSFTPLICYLEEVDDSELEELSLLWLDD